MMPTYAIVLDHVIRKPKTDAVITPGAHLYAAMAGVGRLAVLCGEDEERADWFLRTNGFTQHVHLIPERVDEAITKEDRRMAQIRRLRASQAHVELVVEPDPEVALAVYRSGVPVSVFLHPQFTQPSFRPDHKSTATPWNALIEEVEYQTAMKVAQSYEQEEPM